MQNRVSIGLRVKKEISTIDTNQLPHIESGT